MMSTIDNVPQGDGGDNSYAKTSASESVPIVKDEAVEQSNDVGNPDSDEALGKSIDSL